VCLNHRLYSLWQHDRPPQVSSEKSSCGAAVHGMAQRTKSAAAAAVLLGQVVTGHLAFQLADGARGQQLLTCDVCCPCRPISSVIGQDSWTVAMNAGIFLHCIIAYQVNVNVWCSLLLHVTVPK
jgi:hypothetical protein